MRKKLRRELSPDAVSGSVKRRREGPETALAGKNRHDASADPALPRKPDLVEPVARGLVHPGGQHDGQSVVADIGVDDLLARDGIEAAIGQGGPITARSFAVTSSAHWRV